jgi:2-oxoglutarate dehydrogenase E2 component (dihydrolipoamide succinyltransferase)
MGESITEGTLTKWLKKVGDTVQRDEPLFEISTDKVDAEIPSPAAGTLTEIKVAEGATVQINTVVAIIGDGTENADSSAPLRNDKEASAAVATPAPANPPKQSLDGAPSAAAAPTPANPPKQSLDGAPSAAAAPTPATPAPAAPSSADNGPGTEIPMPQMGESITEGTITKWLKQVGETVQRDEPLFEISTDKVDAEIPSPVAGVLTEIKVPEGATVGVNTVVAIIGGTAKGGPQGLKAESRAADYGTAEAVPLTKASAEAAPAAATPAAAPALPPGERLRSSPLVRKIAKDNNVDLAQVPGTGSAGRITKADILAHLEKPAGAPSEPGSPASFAGGGEKLGLGGPAAPPAAAKPAAPLPEPGSLVPMTKMRNIIARRMVESKQTSPHVHTVFKVDMTRIVRLREREKSKYEQRNGVKLTYMPFITRAAILALRQHPIVNGSVEGDAIRYNRNINIGIAVALEWGLIVPVIKQAEEKNFLGLARAIVDVAERARGKKLAPDEISGGTFTLTNSGIFGEQFGMPIINQPQAAILGIGGMAKEPVVVTDKDGNDSIAIRTMQHFTLGFDHRIVDGADAGKFMSDFKAHLEHWSEDIG